MAHRARRGGCIKTYSHAGSHARTHGARAREHAHATKLTWTLKTIWNRAKNDIKSSLAGGQAAAENGG